MNATCMAGALFLFAACQSVPTTQGDATHAKWNRRLVEPVSAPVTFESPVVATSVRPIYAHHRFPSDSIFGGGALDVYALQARVALTDRLALIATKDGYFDLKPDVGTDENGMADIAGGVKYAFVDDPERGLLVSGGLIFETASGDEEVFQGNGDGVWRPFVSAGVACDKTSWVGALGFNLPMDSDEESTSFDWHFQGAWRGWSEKVALGAEINGVSYVSDGKALPVNFEGGDVINLGAADVSGHDVVTGALALRWNLAGDVWFGIAYETPLTSREDLFDDRVTADLMFFF